MTWALLRCVLLPSAVFVKLPALRGGYVRLGHVTIYVRPLCIRVMDDVICTPTLYVVHDWLIWDRECMHIGSPWTAGLGALQSWYQSHPDLRRP